MSTWLKFISLLGVISLPLSVLAYRMGVFNFGVAFSILQALALLFAVLVLLSLVEMMRNRKKNPAAAANARLAFVLSLIPLLGLATQAYKGKSLPAIHNISTDVTDPPQFNRIAQLRAASHNSLEYDIEALAEVQQQAYPEVKTLNSPLAKAAAYRRALGVVQQLGWDIVAEFPARGVIEASETTMIWGFTDDIAIRIRESQGGSIVDLRSVSRIGRSDLGANAARIEKFLVRFNE